MLRLTVQRVTQSVVVLLLVSAITFLLVNLAPGGPASPSTSPTAWST